MTSLNSRFLPIMDALGPLWERPLVPKPQAVPHSQELIGSWVIPHWGTQGSCHLTKCQKCLWDGSDLGEQMVCRPCVERNAEF